MRLGTESAAEIRSVGLDGIRSSCSAHWAAREQRCLAFGFVYPEAVGLTCEELGARSKDAEMTLTIWRCPRGCECNMAQFFQGPAAAMQFDHPILGGVYTSHSAVVAGAGLSFGIEGVFGLEMTSRELLQRL